MPNGHDDNAEWPDYAALARRGCICVEPTRFGGFGWTAKRDTGAWTGDGDRSRPSKPVPGCPVHVRPILTAEALAELHPDLFAVRDGQVYVRPEAEGQPCPCCGKTLVGSPLPRAE